jgi:outer membrane protein TolC
MRWLTGLCLWVSSVAWAQDDALARLVRDALSTRPELVASTARTEAARERVPLASAWADPMLQVGVQNDGFTHWQVGQAETSWVSVMAAQTFPFPGKAEARERVVAAELDAREGALERTRRTVTADVERTWLALGLAQARLAELERLGTVLAQLEELAQGRAQTSGGLTEVLRARLERTRLTHRRISLTGDVKQALSRLRSLAPAEALSEAPLPAFTAAPGLDDALTQALSSSPELAALRSARAQAIARRTEREQALRPDFTVTAGVMIRGSMEPMWALGVGVPVPVFSGAQQSHRLAQVDAELRALDAEADAEAQRLTRETTERLEAWKALEAQWRCTQAELLPQADALTEASLGAWRTGQEPLTAVLEALSVASAERDAALQLRARAAELSIAQIELAPGSRSSTTTAQAPTGGM